MATDTVPETAERGTFAKRIKTLGDENEALRAEVADLHRAVVLACGILDRHGLPSADEARRLQGYLGREGGA